MKAKAEKTRGRPRKDTETKVISFRVPETVYEELGRMGQKEKGLFGAEKTPNEMARELFAQAFKLKSK